MHNWLFSVTILHYLTVSMHFVVKTSNIYSKSRVWILWYATSYLDLYDTVVKFCTALKAQFYVYQNISLNCARTFILSTNSSSILQTTELFINLHQIVAYKPWSWELVSLYWICIKPINFLQLLSDCSVYI